MASLDTVAASSRCRIQVSLKEAELSRKYNGVALLDVDSVSILSQKTRKVTFHD